MEITDENDFTGLNSIINESIHAYQFERYQTIIDQNKEKKNLKKNFFC